MNIDIVKTGQENLIDLIKHSNPGLEITLDQVTVGPPTVHSDAGKPNLNTEVLITAKVDMGFSGTQSVHYHRLRNAMEITSIGTPTVLIDPTDSDDVILTKICEHLNLRKDDIRLEGSGSIEIPVNENNPTLARVRAKPGGYLYAPALVIDVWLTVPDTDTALEDAIINFELDGFEPTYVAPRAFKLTVEVN